MTASWSCRATASRLVDADLPTRHNQLLALAVQRPGLPVAVVLNMADLAAKCGLTIDPATLSRALGLSVVRTVATQGLGLDELRALLD